jgi:hypothetical protein
LLSDVVHAQKLTKKTAIQGFVVSFDVAFENPHSRLVVIVTVSMSSNDYYIFADVGEQRIKFSIINSSTKSWHALEANGALV